MRAEETQMALMKRILAVLRRFGDPYGSLKETDEEKLVRFAQKAFALVVDGADARDVIVELCGDGLHISCDWKDRHSSRCVGARIYKLSLDSLESGNSYEIVIVNTTDEGDLHETPNCWFEITGIDTSRPKIKPIYRRDAPVAE